MIEFLLKKLKWQDLLKMLVEYVGIPELVKGKNLTHAYEHAQRAAPEVSDVTRKAIAKAAIEGFLENIAL